MDIEVTVIVVVFFMHCWMYFIHAKYSLIHVCLRTRQCTCMQHAQYTMHLTGIYHYTVWDSPAGLLVTSECHTLLKWNKNRRGYVKHTPECLTLLKWNENQRGYVKKNSVLVTLKIWWRIAKRTVWSTDTRSRGIAPVWVNAESGTWWLTLTDSCFHQESLDVRVKSLEVDRKRWY